MSEETVDSTKKTMDNKKHFKCAQCGGDMDFKPGANSLLCPYCQFENIIPQSEEDIQELDFHKFLSEAAESEDMQECATVSCEGCGAVTTLNPSIASDFCPYCGSDLVTSGGSIRKLKPKSLLPFKVTVEEAIVAFKNWINGLWFAPNKLKSYAKMDSKINGMYIPYWTYDCDTVTFYRGQRGEDYWVTESYTTIENGKTVTKTRQVKKTRWYNVSGTVWNNFDDILVLASKSLPKKHTDELEPWDLQNLVPYQDEYLSGFRAETYQVTLEEGMEEAKDIMNPTIVNTIKRDIGGDHQRITSSSSQYNNITFKHILLPVWISAYRYKKEVYRFLVNARTGEVQGERPWSWIKITLAVIAGLILIGGIVALVVYAQNH